MTVWHTTRSVCPVCLRLVDASYHAGGDDGENIVLHKNCPEHGDFVTPVWRNLSGVPDFASLQEQARGRIPSYPVRPATTMTKGCPYDCGLCPEHGQHTCTGLVEVTRRCSLACPVCFAQAGNGAKADPDPSLDELHAMFASLYSASGACNLQISGGEPTEREDLPEIVAMASAFGFGLVQLNSNGLRLASDQDYAARLRQAGLDSVYLQCDGPGDAGGDKIYQSLRGRPLAEAKQAAIEACARAGLGVVLVATVVAGINDNCLGELLGYAVRQGAHVRGLHLQPVASLGRYPWQLASAPRLTLPDLMQRLEEQTSGRIRASHFHAPSCEHPLCSFSAVYARAGSGLSAEPVGKAQCCPSAATQNARANAEGARLSRAFTAAHWKAPDMNAAFATFLSNSGADRRFTLSAMAFQDTASLDLARLRSCCIHVVTRRGRLVPFCAYNLTSLDGMALYRGRNGQ